MNVAQIQTSLFPIFQRSRIEKAILLGFFAREDNSRRSDVDLISIAKTRKNNLKAALEAAFFQSKETE